MSKILVRLKDQSTSFYDGTQDISVVGNRLALVLPNAKISDAIARGILIQEDNQEAKDRYKAQQIDLMKRGLIPDTRKKKEEEPVSEETDEDANPTESKDEDKKAPAKPGTKPTNK